MWGIVFYGLESHWYLVLANHGYWHKLGYQNWYQVGKNGTATSLLLIWAHILKLKNERFWKTNAFVWPSLCCFLVVFVFYSHLKSPCVSAIFRPIFKGVSTTPIAMKFSMDYHGPQRITDLLTCLLAFSLPLLPVMCAARRCFLIMH